MLANYIENYCAIMKKVQFYMELVMKKGKYSKLLSELKSLTFKQKVNLTEELKTFKPIDGLLGELGAVDSCKHCNSKNYYRWGIGAGLQRYRCKDCKRTYNALTNTPLAGLHKKELWASNADEMIKGSSIRATAKACDIAITTSFRWRHRFLELFNKTGPTNLSGIIEADETYFLESHKGERGLKSPRKRGGKAKKRGLSSEQIPVLVVRDRSQQTVVCQLSAANSASILEVLKPVIESSSVLCTDSSSVYPLVSKECGTLHKQLNIKAGIKVIDKVYHIQNVNAYDSRMKLWLKRFHGIATKYLQKYLDWWRFLDTLKNPTTIAFLAGALGLKNSFQHH